MLKKDSKTSARESSSSQGESNFSNDNVSKGPGYSGIKLRERSRIEPVSKYMPVLGRHNFNIKSEVT